MKKNIIIGLLIAGIISAIFLLLHQYNKSTKEKDVLKSNIKTLSTDLIRYKTDLGKNAVKVQSLQIERAKLSDSTKILLDDLNVSKRRVKTLQQLGTTSVIDLSGELKDTVITISDSIQEVQCYNFEDDHLVFSSCTHDGVVFNHIEMVDSMNIAVDPIYKHSILWGLIKWRVIGANITTTNESPYTKISYNKYYQFR